MKSWRDALKDGIATSAAVDAVAGPVVALRGRRDSGSAIAPINAATHALWGDAAADVERATLRHTLPGALINAAGGLWWSLVFQKLFGEAVDRRGLPAAVAGGVATAALAYAVDYHLIPKRLTPGWELRMSRRSLFISLAAMAAGLAAGGLMARNARERSRQRLV